MSALFTLEFWESDAFVLEEIKKRRFEMQLCITHRKSVYFFKPFQFIFQVSGRVVKHFAIRCVVIDLLSKKSIVYHANAAECLSEHNALSHVRVDAKAIRFIHQHCIIHLIFVIYAIIIPQTKNICKWVIRQNSSRRLRYSLEAGAFFRQT